MISDPVEPCPRKHISTGSSTGGDLELEGACTIAIEICREVSGRVCRTSTLNGMNDLPYQRLAEVLIGGETNLARSTTMNCTAKKAQGLGCANSYSVLCKYLGAGLIIELFTEEVASVSCKGFVVKSHLTERNESLHSHMRTDNVDRENNCSQGHKKI